ncbi:MAG: CoA transferase subunit A [Dehalococcoidia bacterium]
MNKVVCSAAEALDGLEDGMTVLVGGWAALGNPVELVDAMLARGTKDLTIVATGTIRVFDLIEAGRVRKVITSFASYADKKDTPFDRLYRAGRIEVELTSQGTLAERIRAGGAGIPAFYSRATWGTPLADGKPVAEFDGKMYVLERAIKGDFSLVAADRADRFGNLTYRRAHRNFNGPMATAADIVVAEANTIVDVGDIDPDAVVTSGVYVSRVLPRQKEG